MFNFEITTKMIINTRRKRKRTHHKRTRPLSLAEQQARRMAGKDEKMVFTGKRMIIEKYDENAVYDFKKKTYEVDSVFGVKGFYFLFDEGLNVVYVGESDDCIKRISQHFNEKVKEFSFFKIYRYNGKTSNRKAIEKRLIKRHEPIYNKQHN